MSRDIRSLLKALLWSLQKTTIPGKKKEKKKDLLDTFWINLFQNISCWCTTRGSDLGRGSSTYSTYSLSSGDLTSGCCCLALGPPAPACSCAVSALGVQSSPHQSSVFEGNIQHCFSKWMVRSQLYNYEGNSSDFLYIFLISLRI